MSFNQKEFGKNIGQNIIEACTDGFFKGAVDMIEEKVTKGQQRDKALEGMVNELLKEKFNMVVNEYCRDIKNVSAYYSEKELREKFNRSYKEYLQCGQHMPDDDNDKEELFKRYKIFVEGYVERLSETISFGEKRILEKEDQIIEEVGNISSKILTSKDFQEISKKQSELMNKLCEDIDIPFVEISNSYAEVSGFHSKYAFFGNVFDFGQSDEREDAYVFTLNIKNIGKTVINEMDIKNFNIYFCKEIYDDNPESGYLILKITEHSETEKCTINLMPNSEQKVHFVTQRREHSLNGDVDYTAFVDGDEYEPKFDNDRLYIEFDMSLVGKGITKDYHFYIFLSRNNEVAYEDIVGTYSVDYVGMELIGNP